MKKVVGMNELVAGLLLTFDKFDTTDLSLVISDLKRKYDNLYIDDVFSNIKEFIKEENGVIALKDGLTMNSYIEEEVSTLGNFLQKVAGEEIIEYCNHMDIDGLTLKKIKELEDVPVDSLRMFFNSKQLDVIDALLKSNCLITKWVDNNIYDDFQTIGLTFLGEKKLYMYQYEKEIEEFKASLKTMRYDDTLVDDFLKTQVLSEEPDELLTVDNFIDYCYSYDRAPLQEGVVSIVYSNDNCLNKEMRNMTSIWDNGHSIYICHPNNIFTPEIVTIKDREIKNINWSQFDIAKMLSNGDYVFFLDDEIEQVKDNIYECFMYHMMDSIIRNDRNYIGYLAVIEKYQNNDEENYLLRGIIKSDKNGLSFAFNSEYQKTIPKTIEEIEDRAKGYNKPNVYCKKYQ